MTKEEFAARLNGREYGAEMMEGESKEAAAAGLLVVFGYSDDNAEFRGVIDDEFGCYDGGEFEITSALVVIREVDGADEDELIRSGWTPPTPAFTVKAEWTPDDLPTSWRMTADLPFAPFDIMEEGELYCRGCVIDTRALQQAQPSPQVSSGTGE